MRTSPSFATRQGPVLLVFGLFFGTLLAGAPEAAAQMFSDPLTPVGRRTQMAGVFSSSDIDYSDDGLTNDIERKILGIEAATNLSGSIDGFGQFGIIADSEIDDVVDDGKGFTFGFGGRSIVHRDAAYKVSAYGALTYQTEEFDSSGVEVEIDTYDLHAGSVVGFAASPTVTPYAGLDLVLLSDGDIKVKVNGYGTSSGDIDRDDMLNLKLGALFALTSVMLRTELVLMGETTFTLAVGQLF